MRRARMTAVAVVAVAVGVVVAAPVADLHVGSVDGNYAGCDTIVTPPTEMLGETLTMPDLSFCAIYVGGKGFTLVGGEQS